MQQLVDSNNDAIIQIKENQSMIYSEAIAITQQCECISTDYQKSKKSHGRINSRRARVFRVDKTLKNTCGKWKEIKCVVEIKK